MLRIAICDDSTNEASALEKCCSACTLIDQAEIVAFNDGELLFNSHQKDRFDIVFLDVDMPNIDGINLGKNLRQIDKQVIIIFYTNYPQYAINAYDCEAFHYLLKPCSQDKVELILKRATAKLGLLHKYHVIRIQNKVQRILLNDIYYIEYCRKHIIYHTVDQHILTTGKFSDAINELQKYGFYQVHQGYIVNLAKVRDIKGYSVLLDNGNNVMISVRKKSDVLLAYAKYVEDYQ